MNRPNFEYWGEVALAVGAVAVGALSLAEIKEPTRGGVEEDPHVMAVKEASGKDVLDRLSQLQARVKAACPDLNFNPPGEPSLLKGASFARAWAVTSTSRSDYDCVRSILETSSDGSYITGNAMRQLMFQYDMRSRLTVCRSSFTGAEEPNKIILTVACPNSL